jgi:tRNA1Val (adenine37-N6)-methyltransferase
MSTFRFQQFSVLQNQSAMKVCTDAILFGAMAPVKAGAHVLDIGTGTGVLSLIAAQLGAGRITAVELTQEAYEEARINFGQSPWADRLEAVHQDIQGFAGWTKQQYDLVISNPPFFANHFKTTSALRMAARHNDLLPFADLIALAGQLVSAQGLLYLLLPVHALNTIADCASAKGFYLIRRIDFRAYEHSSAKVSALTFSRKQAELASDILTVYEASGVYTQDSGLYLSTLLLRFAKDDQIQQ